MKIHPIKINNESFLAHPYGVLFWESKHILLIADVHFGKVSHFRKHGSAVPEASLYTNFEKLNTVIDYFKPKQVIFLGDLFHSHLNNEWTLFENWVKGLTTELILITGNHDIIPEAYYDKLAIKLFEKLQIDNFYLTHHPEVVKGLYNMCGHIHPAIELKGLGKQRIKTACFFKQPDQLILPAFGVFTGTFVISPRKGDEIYGITKDEVIQIDLK